MSISQDFRDLRATGILGCRIIMLKVIAKVTFATVMLAGCETVKGVGKDVSSAGGAVTGSATVTQDKM